MTKKNVAIVITRLDLGGAQKVALELAAKLDRKKFNVHLIFGPGGQLDAEAALIKNAVIFKLPELVHPIHLFIDSLAVLNLKKYFEKNSIDIVHTHSSKAGLIGRFAAAMASNKPSIIHTVHGFPFHDFQNPIVHFMYKTLEQLISKVTNKYIAVGSDVVKYGLQNNVGTAEKYTVIRAGVNLAGFKAASLKSKLKERKHFLSKFGLNSSLYTVGMIGNLKKQKNPLAFVEIARIVSLNDNEIQFVFAGGGADRERIDELLAKYKLKDRVKFIGWCNEPEKMMKSLDLFLLTSLWEGLACTLVQAAACGVFTVATDIDGNREFVKLANSGAVYSPANYKAAAELIISAKLKKKNLKIRTSILKEFDIKFMVKEHEKLYLS